MRFNNFYGNLQVKNTISGNFDRRRIPNAILIEGPGGSGKKTLAKILAAAAVCDSHDEIPCGSCRQCHNATSGNHPDIVIFAGTAAAAGAGSRSFGVDAVRKIRLDAYISPNDAQRKVYILANIQDMTEQAQNALLKILEEPPAFVFFILTCDSRTHVLETVCSRAQCLALGSVSEIEVTQALHEQCSEASIDEITRAARICGGIIGNAKNMLEAGFSEISDFFVNFTKALCATDCYSFVSFSGKLEKDGGLFTTFLNLLPALLRDAVAIKNGAPASLSGCEKEALLLSRSVTIEKLYRAELTALDSKQASDRNVNLTLLLTALFSKLWNDIHS